MPAPSTPGAFQAFGLEIEYMIVRRDTLDVVPMAERLLPSGEMARGDLGWSNELVSHVVELKNRKPGPDLAALARDLQREACATSQALAPLGARLMPGGMHPWMDPRRETRLWPHANRDIYAAYDRVFDCRSHGWANLQSTHLNLPFSNDGEFARLHDAVRLALPLIPAIAASSPYRDGVDAGALDARLEAYRDNARSVPEMNGELVPEPIGSRADYEALILEPLYRALAPHDPKGVLRHEWVNARGAIARFDRSAIEIRLLDAQECPACDVAVAAAVIDLVWTLYRAPPSFSPDTRQLAGILDRCIRDADAALIEDPDYLAALGLPARACPARDAWAQLGEKMREAPHRALWEPMLEFTLENGPLARRMRTYAGPQPSRDALRELGLRLCECLERGERFDPGTLH